MSTTACDDQFISTEARITRYIQTTGDRNAINPPTNTRRYIALNTAQEIRTHFEQKQREQANNKWNTAWDNRPRDPAPAPVAFTDDDIVHAANNMRKHGGGFVCALGDALSRADSQNRAILVNGFAHLIRQYKDMK